MSLNGLKNLTDDTGMFQHSKFSTIDRRMGYTTDDNARALISALKYHNLYKDKESITFSELYLSFLLYMQKPNGSFHNILGFDRRYEDDVGSEDCHGRALWACGFAINMGISEEMKFVAKEIFDRAIPFVKKVVSPRAKAFTVLGLHNYLEKYPEDQNIKRVLKYFSNSLLRQYQLEAKNNWRWFESYLTYSNARLPQAMFSVYQSLKQCELLEVALESLDFLISTQMIDGIFVPIGTKGWYFKGGKRAVYDQQPIEASCMVETLIQASTITGIERYKKLISNVFEWYHGRNTNSVTLYDHNNGTCYDGITPEGLNLNQGAESTLSYYLAFLEGKTKQYF